MVEIGNRAPAARHIGETCWPCGYIGDDAQPERRPGWCSSCGFFFDRYGMQIFQPWLTCPVHIDLSSMCPHRPLSERDTYVDCRTTPS